MSLLAWIFFHSSHKSRTSGTIILHICKLRTKMQTKTTKLQGPTKCWILIVDDLTFTKKDIERKKTRRSLHLLYQYGMVLISRSFRLLLKMEGSGHHKTIIWNELWKDLASHKNWAFKRSNLTKELQVHVVCSSAGPTFSEDVWFLTTIWTFKATHVLN